MSHLNNLHCSNDLLVSKTAFDPDRNAHVPLTDYCSVNSECRWRSITQKPVCICRMFYKGARCHTPDYSFFNSVSDIIKDPTHRIVFLITIFLTVAVVSGIAFLVYKRKMRYVKKINSEEKVFVRSSCDVARGRSNTVPINSNCLDSGELTFLVDRKNDLKTLRIPDFVNKKMAQSLQPTPTTSRTKLIGVGNFQATLVAKLASVSNVDLVKNVGSKCYLPKLSKKMPAATRLQPDLEPSLLQAKLQVG